MEDSSDKFLASGFDLKKAKWVKAAVPGLTKIFLRSSSFSNSAIQATSNSPTLAAWFSVYRSNSSGVFDSGGFCGAFIRVLFLSEILEMSACFHGGHPFLLTGWLYCWTTHPWSVRSQVAGSIRILESCEVPGSTGYRGETVPTVHTERPQIKAVRWNWGSGIKFGS